MYPDKYSLAKAGLGDDKIKEILSCETQYEKYRLLRLCRCEQLDEIHSKQQSLDTLDFIIGKMKKEQ